MDADLSTVSSGGGTKNDPDRKEVAAVAGKGESVQTASLVRAMVADAV